MIHLLDSTAVVIGDAELDSVCYPVIKTNGLKLTIGRAYGVIYIFTIGQVFQAGILGVVQKIAALVLSVNHLVGVIVVGCVVAQVLHGSQGHRRHFLVPGVHQGHQEPPEHLIFSVGAICTGVPVILEKQPRDLFFTVIVLASLFYRLRPCKQLLLLIFGVLSDEIPQHKGFVVEAHPVENAMNDVVLHYFHESL